eukprot:TRINITY_DN53613_c0_g1_i1.p1 TRINITY_DN53613_c0_g1~~TRINITY_DN53613_c0_g1_i1.p1  ORF type:complete len:847 (-),score=171.10 TRINITY_DN53613_c0_g1_i1:48-2588(-)
MDQPATEPEPEGKMEDEHTEETSEAEKAVEESVEEEKVKSIADSEGEDPDSDPQPAAASDDKASLLDREAAVQSSPAAGLEESAPQERSANGTRRLRSGLSILQKGPFATLRLRWAASRKGKTGGEGELLLSDDEDSESCLDDAIQRSSSELAGTGLDTSWQVVDSDGVVVAEDSAVDGNPLAKGSVEVKLERMLTWMLAPAVHGIPKLGVLGADGRAAELLSLHQRDLEGAVREVVAGSERSVSHLVLDFCLERIPVLGCPTVLLRTTWGNLRSILIIAALYGHDLESPRVQHEALLCLVPPGDDKDAASKALKRQTVSSELDPQALVSATAAQVARMTIRGALRRATGLQAAVDCFELASLLYSSCAQDDVDEDGFVHVNATPASAARDFFRKKSVAFYALLWCSLPCLLLGTAAPVLFTLARLLPRALQLASSFLQRLPQAYVKSTPALLLFLAGPCLVAFRYRMRPARGKKRERVHWFQRWLGKKNVGRWEQWQEKLEEVWPQMVTTLVFLLHAVLPGISTMSALSVVLAALAPAVSGSTYSWHGWDLLNRMACASLGVYSLASVIVHQLHSSEAEMPKAGAAVVASWKSLRLVRQAARALCFLAAWVYLLLVLDDATNRLLGQEKNHGSPLGILGPAAWLLGADRSVHPLENEKSMAFCLQLVSFLSQQRLVELLARREVLLRLIGAERMMASTIILLFKGVSVACAPSKSANPIAEFLMRVAPPPACCVAIVALRSQALFLGTAVVLAPQVTLLLGSSMCFLLGLLAGAYIAYAILSVWYVCRPDLDSPALRLAMLVPGGVSNHAKGLLCGVLAGAHRRAVQMMAKSILQRAFRWLTQRQ